MVLLFNPIKIIIEYNMFSENDCSSVILQKNNSRIYERNIPSQPLQPYLSVRPVMTKYSIMPIVDPRAPIQEPIIQRPTYNTAQVFNPGNNTAPWSGYASNVNVESELRNQIYALQKCSQSVYVPNSNSDMYNFTFTTNGMPLKNHSELFKTERFNDFNPNCEGVGQGSFNNHTRQQLKNLSN